MFNLTPVRRLADFDVTYQADTEAVAYLYASTPSACKGDITVLTATVLENKLTPDSELLKYHGDGTGAVARLILRYY